MSGKIRLRERIYVAGPYDPKEARTTHEAPRLAERNVKEAVRIGVELWKMGYNPYVPHLGHYLNLASDVELDGFMERDFEWLDYCEALYFIGHSNGADRELEMAQKKGIPIFYNLEDARKGAKTRSS